MGNISEEKLFLSHILQRWANREILLKMLEAKPGLFVMKQSMKYSPNRLVSSWIQCLRKTTGDNIRQWYFEFIVLSYDDEFDTNHDDEFVINLKQYCWIVSPLQVGTCSILRTLFHEVNSSYRLAGLFVYRVFSKIFIVRASFRLPSN